MIILFCFVGSIAMADYINVESRVLCAKNAAVVQFAYSFNEDPIIFPDLTGRLAHIYVGASESQTKECNLGSATQPHMFRAKLGEFQKHHWGACGAGQRNFLSLWIGGHKIYSKKIVFDGCGRVPANDIDAVIYYDSTLLLCTYLGDQGAAETATSEPWICLNESEAYLSGIAGPIDEVEYPSDGSERREGYVVLQKSNKAPLCNLLYDQFTVGRNLVQVMSDFPQQFTVVPWPWDDPVLIEMDINNDGFPDLVRKGIGDRHGVDDAVVLVRDGRDRGERHPDPPPTFDKRLMYSGETLFPVSKLGNVGTTDNRDFPTLVSPFIWRDESYVLMQAYFTGASPKWAVYQLRPDYSVNEVCVLDWVRINY